LIVAGSVSTSVLPTGDLLAVVLPFLRGAGWFSNWRFLGSQLLNSGNAGARDMPCAIQQHTEL